MDIGRRQLLPETWTLINSQFIHQLFNFRGSDNRLNVPGSGLSLAPMFHKYLKHPVPEEYSTQLCRVSGRQCSPLAGSGQYTRVIVL